MSVKLHLDVDQNSMHNGTTQFPAPANASNINQQWILSERRTIAPDLARIHFNSPQRKCVIAYIHCTAYC